VTKDPEYKFTLNDAGEPVPEPDIIKWSEWMGSHDAERLVKQEKVGKLKISTVFHGMDMTNTLVGRPVQLWETVVFGTKPLRTRRWRSRADAERGHAEVVKWANEHSDAPVVNESHPNEPSSDTAPA